MRQLALSLIAAMLTLATAQARNYVVCVGIADYPGTANDLRLSANDAKVMQQLFQKNGDAVVRTFTDQQATKSAVHDAFAEFCRQATTNDAVVFFFSGHGVPGAFVCYDGRLLYDDILSPLMTSAAGKKIILADACFAGKARRTSQHQAQADGEAFRDKGVLFFLSSRTNEKSIEIRSMSNSIFTAYLERGLRGGADSNRDRTITARELFDFVSRGVAEKSRSRQHPVMWGRFSDDMTLMKW